MLCQVYAFSLMTLWLFSSAALAMKLPILSRGIPIAERNYLNNYCRQGFAVSRRESIATAESALAPAAPTSVVTLEDRMASLSPMHLAPADLNRLYGEFPELAAHAARISALRLSINEAEISSLAKRKRKARFEAVHQELQTLQTTLRDDANALFEANPQLNDAPRRQLEALRLLLRRIALGLEELASLQAPQSP